MTDRLTRRAVLKASGAALALTGSVSTTAEGAVAGTSPDLEKYAQPLPIPSVREPDAERDGVEHYEIPIREFSTRLHPDLPETTLWGYDGQFPGPIVEARRNEPITVRFDNSDLPSEHLLPVDDRIAGTTPEDYPGYSGEVPAVRTVTHFHGLNVAPESDGQADMWESPDGTTGPRHATDVQELPNEQSRLTSTYHDHAKGISRLNVYAGLVGFYFVRSDAEAELDLPTGRYDVPLLLQDRSFAADGSLQYPETFEPNVGGDTMVVNGAVWPYLEVEPRRYRLRFVNASNGRTYSLQLENDDGDGVPTLYQFAAGHGFLPDVVPIGPNGDLDSLLLSPFERGDVLVNFSEHAGETFTVTNDAAFPFEGPPEDTEWHQAGKGRDHKGDDDGHGQGASGPSLPELLQIRVADSGGETAEDDTEPDADSANPATLSLPSRSTSSADAAAETRRMTMNMIEDDHGLNVHLLNDRRFHDETVVKPRLGTTEIWELENGTMHSHPIHLHLVEFEVLGRGPDGAADPAPNERVGKDTVRVDPDETVRIAVEFGDFAGQFPWHCHVLEHEDHEMMRPFEVVTDGTDSNRDGNGSDT